MIVVLTEQKSWRITYPLGGVFSYPPWFIQLYVMHAEVIRKGQKFRIARVNSQNTLGVKYTQAWYKIIYRNLLLQ